MNQTARLEAIEQLSVHKPAFANGHDRTQEPWGETKPLPSLLPSAPALDQQSGEQMIPASIFPWCLDISERMGVALESVAAVAIGALAVVVGRKVGIRPKRYDDWLALIVLWVMIVARPGMKKSPMLKQIFAPIEAIEDQELQKHQDSSFSRQADEDVYKAKKAALQEKLKGAAKEGNQAEIDQLRGEIEVLEREFDEGRKYHRRLKTSDATIEKFGELLKENPNGLMLMRDELSGWMRSLDKAGREGDREFFLEAWNGSGRYTVDRIGRGSLHIPALFISVLGGIQPSKLHGYLADVVNGGSSDDGLLQRFQLAIFPDRAEFKYVDRAPDQSAAERAFRIFEKLDQLRPQDIGATVPEHGVPFLKFDESAQAVFDQWIKGLERRLNSEDGLDAAMEAHLSKHRGLMPALALLFHLVEWAGGAPVGQAVGEGAARKAADWCEFLEGHARKIYSYNTQSYVHSAHSLLKRIKAGELTDGESVRDIYRHQWTLLSSRESVEGALYVLEQHGWVRTTQSVVGERGGAPKTVLRLHPSLKGGVA